jgi:stage III sporulation protein AE
MKKLVFLVTLMSAVAIMMCPAFAEQVDISEEYNAFIDALPDELNDRVSGDKLGESLQNDAALLTDWDYILGELSEITGLGIRSALKTLAVLVGLILISATLRSLFDAVGGRVPQILLLCTGGAVCAAAISIQYGAICNAADYLSDLSLLMNAIMPPTVSLYAMGGNVATAGVSAGAFGIFLNICENFLAKTVIPFSGVCLAFSLIGTVSGSLDLRGISGTVKKTYTTVLSFLMMLFSTVLAAQTALASAADSVSLRATKFVAGSVIPILGGSVGESIKTLATGISVLRKSLGVTGIMLIFLLFMPVLISLLLTRAANGIAASFATMLGCEREGEVLRELASMYGYICGTMAMCSVTFIFTLALLISSGVAAQ